MVDEFCRRTLLIASNSGSYYLKPGQRSLRRPRFVGVGLGNERCKKGDFWALQNGWFQDSGSGGWLVLRAQEPTFKKNGLRKDSLNQYTKPAFAVFMNEVFI